MNMNEDLDAMQYSPIINYNYGEWFRDVIYPDIILSDEDRKQLVNIMDETIEQFSSGLPLLRRTLENAKQHDDEYHIIDKTIASVTLFVVLTMIDSMVICKHFVMAETAYEKQLMRGKLRVLLNEGFKKLYGFDNKSYSNSAWDKLLQLMKYYPEKINLQYQKLTSLLERQAKVSSWWKNERNIETHLGAEELYDSRQEEIKENEVIRDSNKLFRILMAVHGFLTNMHAYIYNYALEKYRRGELKE